jgi:hypothetical protein
MFRGKNPGNPNTFNSRRTKFQKLLKFWKRDSFHAYFKHNAGTKDVTTFYSLLKRLSPKFKWNHNTGSEREESIASELIELWERFSVCWFGRSNSRGTVWIKHTHPWSWTRILLYRWMEHGYPISQESKRSRCRLDDLRKLVGLRPEVGPFYGESFQWNIHFWTIQPWVVAVLCKASFEETRKTWGGPISLLNIMVKNHVPYLFSCGLTSVWEMS